MPRLRSLLPRTSSQRQRREHSAPAADRRSSGLSWYDGPLTLRPDPALVSLRASRAPFPGNSLVATESILVVPYDSDDATGVAVVPSAADTAPAASPMLMTRAGAARATQLGVTGSRGSDVAALVACGRADASIDLWPVRQEPGHQHLPATALLYPAPSAAGATAGLVFNPVFPNALASCYDRGGIAVWDVAGGALPLRQVPAELTGGGVCGVAWSRDGDLIAAACKDGAVRLLDMRVPAVVLASAATPGRHRAEHCHALTFLSRRDRVVSTAYAADGVTQSILLWDITDMHEPIAQCQHSSQPGTLLMQHVADADVLLVAGKGDTHVAVYDASGPALLPVSSAALRASQPFRGLAVVAPVPGLATDSVVFPSVRVLQLLPDSVHAATLVCSAPTQRSASPPSPAPSYSISWDPATTWLSAAPRSDLVGGARGEKPTPQPQQQRRPTHRRGASMPVDADGTRAALAGGAVASGFALGATVSVAARHRAAAARSAATSPPAVVPVASLLPLPGESPDPSAMQAYLACCLADEQAPRERTIKRLLLAPDHLMLRAAVEARAFRAPEVAEAFVEMLQAERLAVRVVSQVLTDEIARCRDIAMLFRTDSAATRLTSMFLRRVGMQYLRTALAPPIAMWRADTSYEVDPRKVSDPQQRQANAKALGELTALFVEAIAASAPLCPQPIRWILALAYRECSERFATQRYEILGGLFFLRFLCPILVQPVRHALLPADSSAGQQRAIVLVTSVLNVIANGTRFRENSAMYMMNEFVELQKPRMVSFFEHFSALPHRAVSPTDDNPSAATSPSGSEQADGSCNNNNNRTVSDAEDNDDDDDDDDASIDWGQRASMLTHIWKAVLDAGQIASLRATVQHCYGADSELASMYDAVLHAAQ